MDKKIHVPTPGERLRIENESGVDLELEQRVEAELDDIERNFYQDLLLAVADQLRNYLLYSALLLLGAWLAFYYLKAYAAKEEAKHG